MKQHSNAIGIFVFVLILLAVGLYAEDWQNRQIRMRGGTTLTLDTTSSIKDEDSNWILDNSALQNLSSNKVAALTITGTTNQIIFGGTNAAPNSTNVIKWVSVRITGETNVYRLGLCQ